MLGSSSPASSRAATHPQPGTQPVLEGWGLQPGPLAVAAAAAQGRGALAALASQLGGSNPQDPAALIRSAARLGLDTSSSGQGSGQPCTGLATAVTDMQAGLMLAAAAAFTRQLVLTMGPGAPLEEFVDAATQALAGLASAPRPFTATQPGDVFGLEQVGFRYVASGPLVRSSYKAGEFFLQAMQPCPPWQQRSASLNAAAASVRSVWQPAVMQERGGGDDMGRGDMRQQIKP
ncbi:uncharacterized protein HaLaN_11208 [Haematococcus lacustris]|uniref:Uncharacterized protein n=1 Tax=Haematococcus lacustris TaxID=44745 RepID=A0A699Z7A6_HAELA|nr:uncharacterized protein HaLaN_11208 [Haematococcus lacustris]